jgi:hypothetical protein
MRRAVRAIVRLFRAGSGGRATNAPEIPEAKAVYDHCQLAPPPGAESDGNGTLKRDPAAV